MCKQDMNPLRNHPYTTGRPRASRPKCEQQKKPLRIYSQETSCIQTEVRRRNDTSGNLHPWGLVHPDRLSTEPSHARMFSCRKIKFKTIPRRRYHKRYDADTAPYAT